jgi:predicted metal-binding membrane protein
LAADAAAVRLGGENILWVAALAVFVLGEKLLPRGEWIGRVGGAVFLGGGLQVLLRG